MALLPVRIVETVKAMIHGPEMILQCTTQRSPTRISTSSTVMIMQYWVSVLRALLNDDDPCHQQHHDDECDGDTLSQSQGCHFSANDINHDSTTISTSAATVSSSSLSSLAGPPSTMTEPYVCLPPTPAEFILSFVSLILWTLLLTMVLSTIILGYRLQHQHDDDYYYYDYLRRSRRRTSGWRGSRFDDDNSNNNRDGEYEDEHKKWMTKRQNERQRYVRSRVNIITSQLSLSKLASTTSAMARSNAECCICLEPLRPDDNICVSQNCYCQHAFHWERCMSRWLLFHDHCPICRRNYLLVRRRQEPFNCNHFYNQKYDDRECKSPKEEIMTADNNDTIPYVDPLPPYDSFVTAGNVDDDGAGHDDLDEDENYREERLSEDWDAVSLLDDLPTWLILIGAM